MGKALRHYVLTRAVYGAPWDLAGNARRLALLAGITGRSLAAQTEQRFTWVVALDPKDPLRDLRERAVQQAGVDYQFVYAAPRNASRAAVAAAAYRAPWADAIRGASDAQVLTTRIDDDDAFTPDALERIRGRAEEADAGQRIVWVIPRGYRVSGGLFIRVRHESNAWMTLAAPVGDPGLVYGFGHTRAAQNATVRFVDEQRGWLWVRHNDTLSKHNHAKFALTEKLRAAFPIDWGLLQ